MAIYGAAYELIFNRQAAGAAIHPNECRLYRSQSIWAGTTTIRATLSRGYIPHPASGSSPNTRRISGISTATVGGPFRIAGDARDTFADFDGVSTANGVAELIQRCGYGGVFVGRGRAAGGDYVAATGDLLTALANGGAATQLIVDCYAGPGYYDTTAVAGDAPFETSDLNGGLWTSHLGIYDFVDDAIDQATRQNALFIETVSNGNRYVLPDGFIVEDCSRAAISPEGLIWVLPADYGTNVPTDVVNNTANAFRNHPGVFVRTAGGAHLRGVTRRWRDANSIIDQTVGQPIGIFQQTEVVTRSKWLVVVDGVADVVYINHPANTDYRRPRDIWNNVIVDLIRSTGSNNNRVTVTDFFGAVVGTETRWKYLSYARFLGDAGSTQQDNTNPVG